MRQEVSFIADKPGPPPAQPLPPGVYTALTIVCGVLAVPSIAAVAYQALENASFLGGGAATWLGTLSGIVAGVLSALGLSMLIVAAGIMRETMKPLAIAALVVFGICLAVSLSAMGSFAWISSKPPRPGAHISNHRPLNEIQRDLIHAANRCVYDGIPYHCDWRVRFSRELANASREDETPPAKEPETREVPGSGVILTAAAVRTGHYMSAWWSHAIILAFASVGAAIVLGTARVLVTPPAVAPKVITALPAKDEATANFEQWATEYLIRAANVDTPTDQIKLAYRISCASRGCSALRGEDFDRKLSAWAYDKFRSVERTDGKGVPVYVGVSLIDDAIGQENKASA